MLADAREVLLRVDALRARAKGLGEGLKLELTLTVDTLFPLSVVGCALRDMRVEHPSVAIRMAVEPLGGPLAALLEKRCKLSIMVGEEFRDPRVAVEAIDAVQHIAVVSADHELARLPDIVHTLQEVNDGLAHGRYFFMDIARDGIALYESDTTELHQPKPKTPKQALAMAQEYFGEWFPAALKRFDGAKFHIERGNLKDAAFDLHQTVERLYHCVLLVCTFYTPHVHNLGFLRTQAERIDPRLIDAWPRDNRADRARFEKLKDAYVKARYSKHYRISAEELAWLGERVEASPGDL